MKVWPWIYLIVSLLEICAEIGNISWLRFLTKPLLMPVLMAGFLLESQFKPARLGKFLLAALFFAWLGDVFLMFQSQTPLAFLGGLASFLTTHILYALCFVLEFTEKSKQTLLHKKPWLISIFVLYGSILLYLIFPGLAEMTLPVIIYASVIMIMCILAMNRFTNTNISSFQWVLFGALSFMISDSVIALNKFTLLFQNHSILASVLIMVLYTAGQYLILQGLILHGKKLWLLISNKV